MLWLHCGKCMHEFYGDHSYVECRWCGHQEHKVLEGHPKKSIKGLAEKMIENRKKN